jgi:hypothetical protein
MAETAVSTLEQEVTEPTCRHHWLIDSPHGATSMRSASCADPRRNSATPPATSCGKTSRCLSWPTASGAARAASVHLRTQKKVSR